MQRLPQILARIVQTFWQRPAVGRRCSTRRRSVGFEPLESRLALAGYTVDLGLTLTKPDGSALTTLSAGDDFVLHFVTQDLRDEPKGVFAAYADITWDPTIAVVTGPIHYGNIYSNGKSGDASQPGLINEGGAFASGSGLGEGTYEVFSVPMRSINGGMLSFALDGPDLSPQHDILILGSNDSVPMDAVHFGTTTIPVTGSSSSGGAPLAVDDSVDVYGDASKVINVLGNDYAPSTGGALRIVAIGTPNHGTTYDGALYNNGGSIVYQAVPGYTGTDTFTYTVSNDRGQTSTALVTVTVNPSLSGIVPYVDFNLKLTKPDGSSLTSLGSGEDFVVHVLTRDRSPNAHGVYAAYLDITWNSQLAVVRGPIQYGAQYQNGKSGDASVPGKLDEAGAFASNWLDGELYEVFSVPMRATATGDLVFLSDPADLHPQHDVLVSGILDPHVADGQISFGSASIHVGTFGASNDTFSVKEDSKNNSLTPLANDASTAGSANTLVISTVSATDHGGTVTIAADGKSLKYTPAANFNGLEAFTYTARNSSGEQHTATVTVNVAEMNDRPTAGNDSYSVARGSGPNVLNPLENDSTLPDSGETLQIIAVSRGNHGGTTSIGADGAHVIYTPAPNFTGTETFTYTIRDRNNGGLTAQATVTVVVSGPASDTMHVPSDGTPVSLDVLANDHAAGPGDQLTIVSVTQPASGSVSIAPDGTHLIYSAAGDVQGTVEFCYVVANTFGQSATASVTLDVGAMSEPGVTLDGGVLQITGSDQRDIVNVSAGRRVLLVTGMIGDTPIRQSFPIRNVQRIEAELGGGNDVLTLAGNVRTAVLADGGGGSDTIIAGGGSAILLGGNGNDRLIGGNRRDVIIGGAGQDQLIGGGESDILIGGTTAYDGDQAALLAIQAQWNVRASRASRVASLRDGTGSFVQPLNVSLQPDATVFDDGAVDGVFGQKNMDWLFGEPGGQAGLARLKLKRGGW